MLFLCLSNVLKSYIVSNSSFVDFLYVIVTYKHISFFLSDVNIPFFFGLIYMAMHPYIILNRSDDVGKSYLVSDPRANFSMFTLSMKISDLGLPYMTFISLRNIHLYLIFAF